MAGLSGGGGGGASGIRAGRAFVSMALDSSLLMQGIRNVEKRMHSFGAGMANIGGAISGIGLAALAPLGAAFGELLGHFDDVSKASERIGTTTEVFSSLAYAADQSGASAEQLESGLAKMSVTLANAAGGSKEAAAALDALGLSAEDLVGLSMDEQLQAIAEGLNKVASEERRLKLTQAIFGKGGKDLSPLLRGGAAGIRELQGRSGLTGSTVGSEEAKNAVVIGDALADVYTSLKNTVRSVGMAFLPLVGVIVNTTEAVVRCLGTVREFIALNRTVIVTVAAVAAGLVAGGIALAGLGGAFMLIGSAIGGAIALLAAVKAAVLVLVSPIGLTVIGITALGAGLAYLFSQTASGQGFFSEMLAGFLSMGDLIKSTFAGISDALGAGDLKLAGEIAMAGLKVAFAEALSWLTGRWNKFAGQFVDGWHGALKDIKVAFSDAWKFVEIQVIDLGQFIQRTLGQSVTKAIQWILDKYIAVMDATNVMGMNDVQIALAENLKKSLSYSPDGASAAKDQAEADRLKRNADLDAQAKLDQDARNKARDQNKAQADDDLKKAQDDYNKKIGDAFAKKMLEDAWGNLFGGGGSGKLGKAVASLGSTFAKGQFGGADAQLSLGRNDKGVAEKSLAVQEEIRDAAEETASRIADLDGVAFA